MISARHSTAGARYSFPLVLALLVVGCDKPAEQPNVLLYVVDTLRADSLAPYGNAIVETPAASRLASEGVLYERAYAASSWTRPSVVSILSGLPPAVHHVETRDDHVPDPLQLLAERYRDAGYATAAVITNPNVGNHFGFDQGYDDFIELYPSAADAYSQSTPSDAATARAVEWIESATRPFFLFVLTTDPHWPYEPPDRFDRYRADARPATADSGPRRLARRAATRKLRSRYYGEVAFNDDSLGRLLEQLDARDLYDETLVVLTADHGEEFDEHGGRGHGKSLYDEVLRVPLIIRHPSGTHAGTRIRRPIQQIDLVPTILELTGLEVPEYLPGRILPPDGEMTGSEDRLVHAEIDVDGLKAEMMLSPPWKLITISPPYTGKWIGGLFNLATDPAEREDRSATAPRVAATLRERLGENAARNTALAEQLALPGGTPQQRELPEDVRRGLEVLGYLDAADPADPADAPE